ncbi:MAG: cbb3-type cytochrome oxidase assembly protein CcoS [Marinagarivorans sp.]|nr:cbb3-type cytochrome oxidase assembly protein CcoS [Marinagarivorans sp.]
MESLYLLIPIAIVLVFVAVVIFFWAVKSGQYDDLDTEGRRILFDDPLPSSAPNKLVLTAKPPEEKTSTSNADKGSSNG